MENKQQSMPSNVETKYIGILCNVFFLGHACIVTSNVFVNIWYNEAQYWVLPFIRAERGHIYLSIQLN